MSILGSEYVEIKKKSKCFSVQLDISILYSLYLNFYDIVITLSFD